MMTMERLLRQLVAGVSVSGYEQELAIWLKEAFAPYADEIQEDKMGNLFFIKRGKSDNAPKLMLAAHLDEIGLMITRVEEEGFLRFTNIGGIDPRTLLGQEVIVRGKEKQLHGIIGAKPPHLSSKEERQKTVPLKELYIDLGLSKAEVEKQVRVGDLAVIKRDLINLKADFVAAKALDDKAGVVMLYRLFQELQHYQHQVDVYAVATVQEEVGYRGAITSSYSIDPLIGIAIDVCHGIMPGVEEGDAVYLGKGAAIGIGPHVHPRIYRKLKAVGDKFGLAYQIEPSATPRGTDAWGIQITRSGVASGLISIPLRYMHTSVETLKLSDLESGAQLLARFISELDEEFVEGLACY